VTNHQDHLGFSPNYDEYPIDYGGGMDWGNWAQMAIQAVSSGGGGGGSFAAVNCPEDPKFQAEHGLEFLSRARQYGVPCIGMWYGNMVQVSPDGSCKRIGHIGGPGGQQTYDMAKAFLADLGTKMAFWGARQPEGGWLFYAPPNYVGSQPPPGFQAPAQAPGPGPVPSPTAYAPLVPGGQVPVPSYPVAQAGMLGGLDAGTMLLLGGGILWLLSQRKR
jgi:hypothetical protein